jgi:hypothetical protein
MHKKIQNYYIIAVLELTKIVLEPEIYEQGNDQ